jgi:hypothetical protein
MKYKTFDDYFNEIENYATRGERFDGEFKHMDKERAIEWLRACWDCAREPSTEKYYTISFPGEHGQQVTETWSEEQIIKSYYPYWFSKMVQANKHDMIDIKRCIEDWCTVHWAIETDEFGKVVNVNDV